jgi:hypothetical protein
MDFKPFDRLPLLEWAEWWDKTIERWHTEGLPPDVTDRYAICQHFGLDLYKQDWFSVCDHDCPQPASHGSDIVATNEDYERILSHLYPEHPVDAYKWQEWSLEQRQVNVVLWFTVDGFFWFARRLLGIERHLYAFYDQPELLHRINSDLADWIVLVIERVCAICTPDFMTFAEDMSYNNGPMLSNDLFNEFMRPYYDRVIPALRNHGVTPIIDSDGDIAMPAHWFAEAGIEGILPLERQSGIDITSLRREHPKMKFIGHFDKMTMDKGEDAMRAEFERLLTTAAKGGFLISCDHQTPPGVSYQNYKTYVTLFNQYAQKAGAMSQEIAEPGVPGDAYQRA